MSEYLLRLHLYVAGVFTVLTGVGSWFHHWGAQINKLVTWIWRSRDTFMWRLGNQMFQHMVTPRVGLKSRRNWQTMERLGQRCDMWKCQKQKQFIQMKNIYFKPTLIIIGEMYLDLSEAANDSLNIPYGFFVDLPWYARDQKNKRLNCILNNWTSLIFHTVTV